MARFGRRSSPSHKARVTAARRLREFVREDWKLKTLAVLFALVLWLFVVGERRAEIGLLVPIEFRSIPPGTVVAKEVEREVQVRLVGPHTLLAAVSPAQVRVALDLSQARPNEPQTFRLSSVLVSAPRGLQVVRVSPPEITVVLDRLATRRVPVEVVMAGRPQAGLEVTEWRAEPPEVLLAGAARDLKPIRSVETERIDLSGATGDLARDVPIRAPPGGVRIEGSATVRVTVRLTRGGS